MKRLEVPEHPEIAWALRTGYPSWLQEQKEGGEDDAETEPS